MNFPVPQFPHAVFAATVHVEVRFVPAPQFAHVAHVVWPDDDW